MEQEEREYVASMRDDLRSALSYLPAGEQDAVQTALDNNWPICVGTWNARGEKQSYTCVMGAAALAATEHLWKDIPAICNDLGSMEDFALNHLSEAAFEVPGPFDEFFGSSLNTELTTEARGIGTKILNAAGRRELAAILAEARAQLPAA